MPRLPLTFIQVFEQFQPYTNLLSYTNGTWEENVGTPLPTFADAQNTVEAVIKESRWLVDCPGDCGSAAIVSKEDRFFLCVDCGSFENDNQWYKVIFPADAEAIETVLLKRRLMKNRNWIFKIDGTLETVEELEAENIEHGLG